MPRTIAAMRQQQRNKQRFVLSFVLLLASLASAVPQWSSSTFPSASGPIQDAMCNVEDLEQANDSQLHTILMHLINTSFFRTFVVDLDERCPISTLHGNAKKETKESNEEDEAGTCAGLPDMDPEAEPACSVNGEQDTLFPYHQGATFSGLPPEEEEATTTTTSEEEDDDFVCPSAEMDLDDDAEPLCELKTEDYVDTPLTPLKDLITSAIRSLSFGRWESESQKDAFSWSQKTDPVVHDPADEDCEELTDAFWMDMCSKIKKGDTSKKVNLILNPERNTGYNGTHIWNAIYRENCIIEEDMCMEERVLYRLLSGLHTSTTLSIAKNYFAPSARKGRDSWEPNPQYFMERFADNPEYIRNLHFSYVVLLRALRKASPFLYNYEIRTGNIVEDETATILMKRLLDSAILHSCQNVFSAFDESLMFKENNAATLQQNFKGVFHNVSSILDCVQCQQCKLHGKMAMLGYGTALKILFMNEKVLASSLDRNEIVAFVNTIAKFSESLHEVRELTNLYWDNSNKKQSPVDMVGSAVSLVASLVRGGHIDAERGMELVQLSLDQNSELLMLAKHYENDVEKFLELSKSIGELGDDSPDVIVVGSGLAGLSAALNVLDRGGKVVVMEKEHLLGGNSNKASSGINACCSDTQDYGDYKESFRNDTVKSAGDSARLDLIEVLVDKSDEAVTWLKERVGVDLSLLAQLGGHSHKRTHRPSNGMAGAEIIFGMQKAVRAYEKTGKVTILVDTRVSRLLTDDTGRVCGVEYETNGEKSEMRSTNVVLATGGFAADRSSDSYLSKYRPELLQMPATAGAFSTGDGIALATALGAGTVDMDKVQVHPTGWIDPKDPNNPSKILAAELMRGVGGILINSKGERFCNELGNRAYVTDRMLSHDSHYAETGKWNAESEVPVFSLVLASSAAQDGKKHVDLYTHKGLLKRLEGIQELADWMEQDVTVVRATLDQYRQDAEAGIDQWGRTSFRGAPADNLKDEVFYAGKVTPVLHYCMGGITIDTEGNVVGENGEIIQGLHAAGEVSGGVHGSNRLGGNSLLECTVFGTIVGKKLPIRSRKSTGPSSPEDPGRTKKELRDVTVAELQKHNTPDDCWVAIGDIVYDLTAFAEEHPAGPLSIRELAGMDGTAAFETVHSMGLLDDFDEDRIGYLVTHDTSVPQQETESTQLERTVTLSELESHNSSDDCWVAFHGAVYDMTTFAPKHPGGASHIQHLAGTDGTKEFARVHKEAKLKFVRSDRIGNLVD